MSTSIVRGNVARLYVVQATLSPAQVNTIICAEQTFTIPGVKVGDIVVSFSKPTANTVAPCAARVSAADTIAITFVNPTAGNVTPTASQTWTFVIARPEGSATTVLTP